MTLNIFSVAVAALFCVAAVGQTASAQTPTPDNKPAIVLVHGAYADGTSWSKVISLLQVKGYHVVSVQNPTTSLADDVTATERVLNQQKGPVVLVGHSWAGVVITQAGNHPNVKALVYVDASAPDNGQSILDAAAALPAAPGASAGVKDEYGFLTLPEAAVRQYFAQDLSHSDQGIISATQTPWAIGCLTNKVTKASWRDKPSWWVIGENDHMINPKLQEKMATQMKAKVTKVSTSHLAMLVAPEAVTAVIVDAANKVQSTKPVNTPAGASSVVPSSAPVHANGAAAVPTAAVRANFDPPPVVPLASQPPARLIVDSPHPESLAAGRVVLRYRAENLRITPVYGPAALDVSPRIGHLHITVDGGPWRWVEASGEPLIINKLPAGRHKVLIELVDPNHQVIEGKTIEFIVPQL
jgi:pimeloyl-ACP methyl ester carboxylesterase